MDLVKILVGGSGSKAIQLAIIGMKQFLYFMYNR
jgi:hypothetical protein